MNFDNSLAELDAEMTTLATSHVARLSNVNATSTATTSADTVEDRKEP